MRVAPGARPSFGQYHVSHLPQGLQDLHYRVDVPTRPATNFRESPAQLAATRV